MHQDGQNFCKIISGPLNSRPLGGGKEFSALERLQYWTDLVSSGISPGQVKLIGINGDDIAAFEYWLALMLEATVGVMESSGREAAHIFKDADWANSKTLLRLSADKRR